MTEYYLEPKNDRANSFYHKAKVVEEFGTLSLISYKSCICQIRKKGEDDVEVVVYDVKDYYGKSLTFSNTSIRHLKEFLIQNGLTADSKAQICKDYIIVDSGNVDKLSYGVKM